MVSRMLHYVNIIQHVFIILRKKGVTLRQYSKMSSSCEGIFENYPGQRKQLNTRNMIQNSQMTSAQMAHCYYISS
eukprot:2314255-Pleurochrysis_carterae.AAC.1